MADAVKEDTDLGRSANGGLRADLRCVFDEWRIGSTYEAVCLVKNRPDQVVAALTPPEKPPVKTEAARQ